MNECRIRFTLPGEAVNGHFQGITPSGARPTRAGSVSRLPCTWLPVLLLGLGLLAGPGRALAQRPLGIDVFQSRGTIDWAIVKASGITFAWARATETLGSPDPTYYANVAGARAAGVLIGSYHDAHYDTDAGTNGAAAEADYFWSVAQSYLTGGGHYLMPMLAVEAPPTGYTRTTLSQWVNQWCLSVSNHAAAVGYPGVKPVIYVATALAPTWLDSTVTQWTPFLADWNGGGPQPGLPNPIAPWTNWVFWQYAISTNVPGVPGTCDGVVFNGTLAGLSAYVIGGVPPVITTQPASQTVPAGANVTFSVGVSGPAPFYYHWRFNGADISGATASSYTKNNVQTTDAGSYSVVVSNLYPPTATSANAVLTVVAPTEILTAPAITGGGLFQCSVAGAAGSNYVMACSTNLTDWVPLATNTSPFTFTDTNGVNAALRFYRAKLWP
jgi:GH25 family lysozyme M1 (1,4-beta-N-acetylmuramidase)